MHANNLHAHNILAYVCSNFCQVCVCVCVYETRVCMCVCV
jgi:hypothetical protein